MNDPITLVDKLLAEQRDLSAVDRFARGHAHQGLPLLEKAYRELIPLTKPQPGEQYAFNVDLDKCSGCKACVSACHSLNGLDEGEMWRNVGLLIGAHKPKGASAMAKEIIPYLQTITTACHHCVEPACADGCPVLAYDKDPLTGIVRHLDDQCIGCQYCILKCPYEVPKYSARKGIVRKCDMCQNRLAVGEAPACVQSCPSKAITIEIVNQAALRAETAPIDARLLPGAFSSSYTRPSTRFSSENPIPDSAKPANDAQLRLEHAHWPLVIMLVLTQLAGGLHVLLSGSLLSGWDLPVRATAAIALLSLVAGLNVALLHLGRPLKAWRVFLGWRKSWMSREIIAFSIYAASATMLVLQPDNVPLASLTAFLALAAIGCSAMIYVDTRRPSWLAQFVFPKFFGATVLLGLTAGTVAGGWLESSFAPTLMAVSILIRAAMFFFDWTNMHNSKRIPMSPLHRSALTEWKLLRPAQSAKNVLFGLSILFSVPAIVNAGQLGFVCSAVVLATTFVSQLLERYLFFAASPAPRMPGGIVA